MKTRTLRLLVIFAIYTGFEPQLSSAQQPPPANNNAATLAAKIRQKGAPIVERSPKLPGGSILVLRNGQVIANEAFGYVNAAKARPWQTDEIVKIASITKPITATLVAILVDEGKLSFDDPVAKYLPGFDRLTLSKAGNQSAAATVRSPTIAECLSHTAGFSKGTVKNLPRSSAVFSGRCPEVCAEIQSQPLAARPGARFGYTFRGYAVVAGVIEKVTGKRYSTALAEKLLNPLEMHDTGYVPHPDQIGRISNFAGLKPSTARLEQFIKKQEDHWHSPAGGLYSSASDLAKFFQFHIDEGKVDGKALIKKETLRKLYKTQPNAGNYALGFNVENKTIRHGGATGTLGWADYSTKTVFIGLTQAGSANSRVFFKQTSEVVSQ